MNSPLQRRLVAAREHARNVLGSVLSGSHHDLHLISDDLVARLLPSPQTAIWRAAAARIRYGDTADPIAIAAECNDIVGVAALIPPSFGFLAPQSLDHLLQLQRNISGLRILEDVRAGIVEGDGEIPLQQLIDWHRRESVNDQLAPLDLAAAIASAQEPIPWLLPTLLAEGDSALLAGDAGAGKSWIGYDIALAAARGVPGALQFTRPTPTPVLLLDEEMSPRLIGHRLAKVLEPHEPLPTDTLSIVAQQGLNLRDGRDLSKLRRYADRFAPRIIIIDSAIRVSPGIDWNDSSHVAEFFAHSIGPIQRDTGAAVLVLAHCRKPAAGQTAGVDLAALQHMIRGSSDMPAAVNMVWVLTRRDDERTLTVTKSRWTSEPPPLGLRFDDIEDHRMAIVPIAASRDIEATCSQLLTDAGTRGVLRSQLIQAVEATGASAEAAKRGVTRALAKLSAKKMIAASREEGSKTGRSLRYWLTHLAPSDPT